MIIYRDVDLTRLILLLIGGLVLLAGLGHSTAEAAPIIAPKNPIACADKPSVKWVYKPTEYETNLMLYVTVSCTDASGRGLETEGETLWGCTNVGSAPVKKIGTALMFNGDSGLDCTGKTVQDVVEVLIGEPFPDMIEANNFYVQSHVQPFTGNEKCAQAYRGTVETYQSYLPVFDDGNTTYRLDRTARNDEFVVNMNMIQVYQNDADGLADTHSPHTFYSTPFVTDPAAIVRSHYISGVMTHTEGYNTSTPTVLNSDTVLDKTFYLETNTTKIQLGYDDVNQDSVIDNTYCGYIIDLEIDPINPHGFG